ncbi:hypothetical protein SmJEL517_g02731 [Synchytrium microbalum]|uniref:Ubiquitin-like domain-containing protein n=1 Tax=Synchytrium microbalum TaxID=1806994 RepID=A0A507BZM6_9FUNG|nr:uncharacterized protein SmJEL517_g02731 [Synchytrium microbalum]TPX34730.1 hypothetical protein SmJEL517_g02731 [Synchytrium microbalum]
METSTAAEATSPMDEDNHIPFKVTFKDQTWSMSLPPTATVEQIKKSVEEMSEIPKELQKLLYKGILKDDSTLTEAKIIPNCKIILMASKLEAITSIAAASSSSAPAKKESLVAVVTVPLSDMTEHKKHIEKKPADIEEGVLNKQIPIPERGLTNLYDQRGVKTRLGFRNDIQELLVATKERTQKFPYSSVRSVKSEPIRDHPEYHILVIQLGPTEKSSRYLYWCPAQYTESVKDAILGKFSFF